MHFELKPELITSEVIAILELYLFKIVAELGLQSIDPTVLKNCDRTYNIEKTILGLDLLNKSSIFYKIDLMYGLPGDNFFKFLISAKFVLNHSRLKRELRAHHFMVLNNSGFANNSSIKRFKKDDSSLVIQTESQNILDLYLTKLYVDLINSELKLS